MKKITLIHITEANKASTLMKFRKHSISLGNGSITYFTNINRAKDFLSKTNRFLNDRLYDLNELHIEVYTHFQRTWFYFDNSELFARLEANCNSNFSVIRECMNLAYSRSHYNNGNHMTFKHIRSIQNSLIEIATAIKEVHISNGNYAESNCINVLIRRILYLQKLIDVYPNDIICNHNLKAEETSGSRSIEI